MLTVQMSPDKSWVNVYFPVVQQVKKVLIYDGNRILEQKILIIHMHAEVIKRSRSRSVKQGNETRVSVPEGELVQSRASKRRSIMSSARCRLDSDMVISEQWDFTQHLMATSSTESVINLNHMREPIQRGFMATVSQHETTNK